MSPFPLLTCLLIIASLGLTCLSTRITGEPFAIMRIPGPIPDLLEVGSRNLIPILCLGPTGTEERILRILGFFDAYHGPQFLWTLISQSVEWGSKAHSVHLTGCCEADEYESILVKCFTITVFKKRQFTKGVFTLPGRWSLQTTSVTKHTQFSQMQMV